MKKIIFLALLLPFFASAQLQTDAALINQNNTTIREVVLKPKSIADQFKTVIDSKVSQFVKNRTVTANDAIVQNDQNGIVVFNSATPITFTINQLTQATTVNVLNKGAGAVTFAPGAGVTITGVTLLSGGSFFSGVIYFDSQTSPIITTSEASGSPITTQGDLIVGGSGGIPTRLAAGSNNTYLFSNGTNVSWQPPPFESLANKATITTGTFYGFVRFPKNLVVFDPASALASFQVAAPSGVQDGDILEIQTGQTISSGTVVTSLNITTGTGTFATATPTTLVSGDYYKWQYQASSSKWLLLEPSLKVTTTGTSGPATFVGNTLNIPQYTGGAGGGNQSITVSPALNFDPDFLIYASGIVSVSNTFSSGNPITYQLLDFASAHNYSFFTSVIGDSPTQSVQVNYPTVKQVLNLTVTPDESFSAFGISIGPTVGLNNARCQASRVQATNGIRLTGNGTATWTKNGSQASSFDITNYATGSSFNITSLNNSFAIDYDALSITYMGTNRYTVARVYSGLGIYNARFYLIDAAGNPVTTNPTANDEVSIVGGFSTTRAFPLGTWSAENSIIGGGGYNFWVSGTFVGWMVAQGQTQTTVLVKWQNNYPSATSYKIFRDTNPNFTTQVQIYSGTGNSVTDTGRTANTLYYYKMVAVISGVDTNITTFAAYTKP